MHRGLTFRRDHPGISVQVEVDSVKVVLEALRQGQLDLAVVLGPVEHGGLVGETLIPCYFVPVGLPGHRLAGTELRPCRELAEERLILPGRASVVRKTLDRIAAGAGTTFNVVLQVATIDAILQSVLDGLGVTVMPTPYVAAEIASGRLSILHVEGFSLKIEWSIVHSDIKLTPSARALKDYLLRSRELLSTPVHKYGNV